MAGVSFDDIGSGDVMKLEELPIKNGLWVSGAAVGSVSKWIILLIHGVPSYICREYGSLCRNLIIDNLIHHLIEGQCESWQKKG